MMPVVLRHIEMMAQANLVEGRAHRNSRGGGGDIFLVTDLTWDGHDFLAALRNNTVWGRMKQTFAADGIRWNATQYLESCRFRFVAGTGQSRR